MWGERSTDEQAAQVIERLEAMGLAEAINYKFDTARIVEVPEGHWAFGVWRWALFMEDMYHDTMESFAGSPWPIEVCLNSPQWELADNITDSTIVPYISPRKK